MNRKSSSFPHSWSIEDWPAEIHPGTPTRARYLVRAHRASLISEGAIARVGRELVIIGERYACWLEKRTSAVPEFEIAPNRARGEEVSA